MFEEVKDIEEEMKKSYISYAMSVIVSRALPDVRDGLKPVHRRIIYSLKEIGSFHNKPYVKSARVVGHALAYYHPHGDTALYEALVRLAQDFSLLYPLIDGQGNFGSVDGDPPAAMRYTEVRLSKIGEEMLADIDEDTVDFKPNFDNSTKEPVVLPTRIPNLLVNGASGIAVAMACEIPPHNLEEVCNALIAMINEEENPERHIRGPDFPTGGIIIGKEGIKEAYENGKGKITIMAKTHVEGNNIFITEIPYKVAKSKIIEEIVDSVKNNVVEGIADVFDRSDKSGLLIEIKVKKGYNPKVILEKLLSNTSLKITYNILNVAIVNGRPKLLTLKELLTYFLDFRRDVTRRKILYRLKNAEERLHLLKGIALVFDDVEKAIQMIKSAKDAKEAKEKLIKAYNIDERQSQAILDMKLQKLASLERQELINEMINLEKKVEEYKSILSDNKKIDEIIKNEIIEIREKYKKPRKTEIIEGKEGTIEHVIEDSFVILTQEGFIKRVNKETIKEQRKGGVGLRITSHDQILHSILEIKRNEDIIVFSNKGKAYKIKASDLPLFDRYAKGVFIGNIISMEDGEKIVKMIKIKNEGAEDVGEKIGESEKEKRRYVFIVTKKGFIKKLSLEMFLNIRRSGLKVINFKDNDNLADVTLNEGEMIMVFTKKGKAIMFKPEEVRETGRSSIGVKAIKLDKDEVSSITSVKEKFVVSVTSFGFGKLTEIENYKQQRRGGKGIIAIKLKENESLVFSSAEVNKENNLIITTKNGVAINIKCQEIPVYGRNSHGVKLIKLKGNEVINVAIF